MTPVRHLWRNRADSADSGARVWCDDGEAWNIVGAVALATCDECLWQLAIAALYRRERLRDE